MHWIPPSPKMKIAQIPRPQNALKLSSLWNKNHLCDTPLFRKLSEITFNYNTLCNYFNPLCSPFFDHINSTFCLRRKLFLSGGQLPNLLDVLVGRRVKKLCAAAAASPLSSKHNSHLIATSSFYLRNKLWRKAALTFNSVFIWIQICTLSKSCSFGSVCGSLTKACNSTVRFIFQSSFFFQNSKALSKVWFISIT